MPRPMPQLTKHATFLNTIAPLLRLLMRPRLWHWKNQSTAGFFFEIQSLRSSAVVMRSEICDFHTTPNAWRFLSDEIAVTKKELAVTSRKSDFQGLLLPLKTHNSKARLDNQVKKSWACCCCCCFDFFLINPYANCCCVGTTEPWTYAFGFRFIIKPVRTTSTKLQRCGRQVEKKTFVVVRKSDFPADKECFWGGGGGS